MLYIDMKARLKRYHKYGVLRVLMDVAMAMRTFACSVE